MLTTKKGNAGEKLEGAAKTVEQQRRWVDFLSPENGRSVVYVKVGFARDADITESDEKGRPRVWDDKRVEEVEISRQFLLPSTFDARVVEGEGKGAGIHLQGPVVLSDGMAFQFGANLTAWGTGKYAEMLEDGSVSADAEADALNGEEE